VQSTGQPGEVTVSANTADLPETRLTLHAKPAN
jgi:hypothetical protein